MRVAFLIIVAALVLVPATASAAPKPSIYYLRDGDTGPIGAGALNETRPNATQPSMRPVPVGATDVVPVRFQVDSGSHPDRVIGPVILAVWLGASPVANGNLTAELVVVNATGTHSLLNSSFPLDANTSYQPNPETFIPVPPDVPPADPEGYAMYVAYHEMNALFPFLMPPPRYLYLGVVNIQLAEGDLLAVDFKVTQGSSPLPVPAGAFATLQYDGQLTPSLVYVPWYEMDQPYSPSSPSRPATRSQSPASSSSSESESPTAGVDEGSDTPSIGLLVALGAIALAMVATRRKK